MKRLLIILILLIVLTSCTNKFYELKPPILVVAKSGFFIILEDSEGTRITVTGHGRIQKPIYESYEIGEYLHTTKESK